MARLPRIGEQSWGDVLDEYLLTAHDANGKIRDNSISEAHLDSRTRAKLNAVVALAKDPKAAAAFAAGITSGQTGGSRFKLAATTTTVTSVNTRTGAVTLTSTDVGLASVNNTSDANKPISTATQTALNAKAATTHTHTASQISNSTATGQALMTTTSAAAARSTIGAGTSSLVIGTAAGTAKSGDYIPTKTDVGLSNVDNTSDANKPISTATQTALNAKAPLAAPSFTGTVTVPIPVNATDAATKDYVDTTLATITGGTFPDATTTSKGKLMLSGDFGGSADVPRVTQLSGVAVPASAPTPGQVLTATSTTQATWTTPATAGTGPALLLIDNATALPAGTPAGVVVVVKQGPSS